MACFRRTGGKPFEAFSVEEIFTALHYVNKDVARQDAVALLNRKLVNFHAAGTAELTFEGARFAELLAQSKQPAGKNAVGKFLGFRFDAAFWGFLGGVLGAVAVKFGEQLIRRWVE